MSFKEPEKERRERGSNVFCRPLPPPLLLHHQLQSTPNSVFGAAERQAAAEGTTKSSCKPLFLDEEVKSMETKKAA